MKKFLLVLLAMILIGFCTENDQAQAYTVTLQKDGMYAEVLPDAVVENATVFFKRNVDKAKKYYEKYQDAGAYTIATKVPDSCRDFMSVAKKIQDSDEIVIRNPFYIYEPSYGFSGMYEYYFIAEKSGKKLCLFSINVDAEDGSKTMVRFSYDKMMDRYFLYDQKTLTDTIFYKMDGITYAETAKKITMVRNQQENGLNGMTVGQETTKQLEAKFQKKSYAQKMDEIFAHLNKIKKEPNTKKAEKDIKKQLKEDYVAPKESAAGKYNVPGWLLPVVGVVAVLIVGELVAAGVFRKKHL